MGVVKLLLDTHALVWWVTGSDRLGAQAKTELTDRGNEVVLSAASAWEIATKTRLGRLSEGQTILIGLDRVVRELHLTELPITRQHASVAGSFTMSHRDPFDRMLAAQAATEGARLVTVDPAFADFPISVIW